MYVYLLGRNYLYAPKYKLLIKLSSCEIILYLNL